jgi:hypothetical protein
MRQPQPPAPTAVQDIPDRRQSPRRRLRDRIASLDRTGNPALAARPALQNLVMLADDDLRQTALALAGVEAFLCDSMELLEAPDLDAATLHAHAAGDDALARLEVLADSVATLRRRMLAIAAAMK